MAEEDLGIPTPTPGVAFHLETVPEVISLPETQDKTKVNIIYPLIPPYAFAHIYWDPANNEMRYEIEEPKLDNNEADILALVEKGIEELINISFINVKRSDVVIVYLEKNIKVLLAELGIKVTEETFLKIMYYIYRNFVGLNEIEPLMKDYFIEDIECNGVNTPIYIVHRKYRNIKTNIVYQDPQQLTSFVEKLAQKCGKYISYAHPILDGRLPDKSRVNATYTQDISTRGPTFTIRRFTTEPYSPIKLMQLKTVSPEMLAYLWLVIEHEANFLVIGGTGSGKCVTGDTKIYLPDGKIKPIKEIVESRFEKNKDKVTSTNDGWEYLEDCFPILTMDTIDLKIKKSIATKIWRHKAPAKLIEITTRSGRKVTTTPEHPFFTTENLALKKIRADEIKINERIAVPRRFSIENKEPISLLNYILNEKDIYVPNKNKEIVKILEIIKNKYNLKNRKELAKKLGYNYDALRFWAYKNAIPLIVYTRLKKEADVELEEHITLKAKSSKIKFKLPTLTPELFRFIALVIGDGHMTNTTVELDNCNKLLLDDFLELGKKLFKVSGKIKYSKNRVTKSVLCSSLLVKVLNKIFKIPIGNKARIVDVPEILYTQEIPQINAFLRAIADCESSVNKKDIEISTTSKNLAKGISTLFLRCGIVSRLITRKDHFRIYISGMHNLREFYKKIGYLHPEKKEKLEKVLAEERSRVISNVDLVPNVAGFMKSFRSQLNISQAELAKCMNVSGRLIGMWETGYREPSIHTFNALNLFIETDGYFENNPDYFKIESFAESDIFWDEISNVEIIENHHEQYVYDLTVDETHNFLAGDVPMVVHNTSMLNSLAFFIPPESRIVSIEDTHELNLMHENWLPSVAREATGVGAEGNVGEVDLFALLKESFRQRPDFVIVGEIRGKEAYVLFQGAASGHAVACTLHAEDVDTMIRRLETEPINLPGSLLETIDVVCIMGQVRVGGEEVRRVKSVVEIVSVSDEGEAITNTPFVWDPKTDTFFFKTESVMFNKLVQEFGLSPDHLQREFSRRTRLFMELYKRDIMDYREVQKIINTYYKTPEEVVRKFNL